MPYKQSHLAVANRTDLVWLQQGHLVKKQRTRSRIHTRFKPLYIISLIPDRNKIL